jgi:hypothetical protein
MLRFIGARWFESFAEAQRNQGMPIITRFPRKWPGCGALHLARAAIVLGLSWYCAATHAATAAPVDHTIDKAKQWVYSQMKGDNWEKVANRDTKASPPDTNGGQWGGLTALSTYALLAAGESTEDPRLAKAINFLLNADISGVYALGMRSQVWLNLHKTDQIRAAIQHDAGVLLRACKTSGPNAGLYTYLSSDQADGTIDHSVSQYGVLGLWACSDADDEIPQAYWEYVDRAWRRDQGDDGSWGYNFRPGTPDPKNNQPLQGSASMTAAGVATLFITQDLLRDDRAIECEGNRSDANIDAGLKWMADHFSTIYQGDWPFYSLYGVERIGVASGHKYFGSVNWFAQGVDWLIKAQNPDGSFPSRPWADGPSTSLENTCFALLFLSRGRAPVIMNKLQYSINGKEANWNERPRDIANLTRWVGKETEDDLNWQISNINAPVEDWHDSPILYMSGNQTLKFNTEEKNKLRTYVEDGGLIVGNADCGNKNFADSFRALGVELFKGRVFAPLPASHPIFQDEQFLSRKWSRKPDLLGLDNGARELMLLLPQSDPAKAWQMQAIEGREQMFQLADNIVLYSVDKTGFYNKDAAPVGVANPSGPVSGTIEVARIRYGGNWNPEPGGWRRLSRIMHDADRINLQVDNIDPALGGLKGKKIAHLTGTDEIELSEAAQAAIKAFIDGGGTLIIDAAGGNQRFAVSIEADLKKWFPESAQQIDQPLPLDNGLFTHGPPLNTVRYRQYAKSVLGRLDAPRLRGIRRNGRLAVIYSAEDLSVGLVGQAVDGIVGYDPETATILMRKILIAAK